MRLPWQAADIGPKFDVGIATRDGSTIQVKNKDGKLVSISSLAYMLGTDKQQPFKEATELQEKSQLVQFASSALIDREFDQWPQVTQGDWSGGLGQRIFGSNGDQTRYFDGEGLLWHSDDWIPSKGLPGPFVAQPAGSLTLGFFGFAGAVGGDIGALGNGYAQVYLTAGNVSHVIFRSADTTYDVAVGAVGDTITWLNIAGGYIWAAVIPAAGTSVVMYRLGEVGGTLAVIQNDNVVTNVFATSADVRVLISAALVSGKLYVATSLSYQSTVAGNPWVNEVVILDYSTTGAPVVNVVPFPTLPASQRISFDFDSLAWVGTTLFIAYSDFASTFIVSNTPGQSAVSEVAVLTGLPHAQMGAVGSTLVLIATTTDVWGPVRSQQTNATKAQLFTLVGGTLTEIGPVNPLGGSVINWISAATSFADFVCWAMVSEPQFSGQFGPLSVSVYAFDAVRSRLYRALTAGSYFGDIVGAPGPLTNNTSMPTIALVGKTGPARTLQAGASYNFEFMVALCTSALSGRTEFSREFSWGVTPVSPVPSFTGILQTGVDLTSGIFDFTAATNKLWRQLVLKPINGFLAGQGFPHAFLNAWFNQDPARLATPPDFSIDSGIAPNPVPPSFDLNLVTNEIARKAVYEVGSDAGPGFLPAGAGQINYNLLGTAQTIAGGGNLAVALTAGASVGDLVTITAVGHANNFDATSTVTDNRGNVWVIDVVDSQAAVGGVFVAHSVLTTALVPGDITTIHWKLAGVGVAEANSAASVIQITGIPNAVVDQTAHAHGNSNSAASGPAVATFTYETLVGVIGETTAVISPGSGWTAIGLSGNANVAEQPLVQSSRSPGQGYNAQAGLSAVVPWQAALVSFKSGNAYAWANAPKVENVIVQAATGWVTDLSLALSPNVKTNGQAAPEYCFQIQGTDHVAAYNFLKQLWRQKGGEILVTWPNLDSYPGLIQQMEFSSPKPFAASMRSDQQSSLQQVCLVKIREDI